MKLKYSGLFLASCFLCVSLSMPYPDHTLIADYEVQKHRTLLVGQWEYLEYKNGFQEFSRRKKFYGRGFIFKRNGRVIFKDCTDRCGCVEIISRGNWEWVAEDSILATYPKIPGVQDKKYQEIKIEKLTARKMVLQIKERWN